MRRISTALLPTVLALICCFSLGLGAPAHAQFWGAPLAPPPLPPAAPRPRAPGLPPLPKFGIGRHPDGAKLPGQGAAKPGAPPQAAAPEPPAPYDHDLERLSEILGALHFLRGLCNNDEGLKWRNEAQTLIDAEAPAGDRHDAMVASFNRGYRGYQQSYRTCTPAADVVIRRSLAEGAKIARDITARYAN